MPRKKKAAGLLNDVGMFCEYLKGRGLKATPQRVAVHEAMLELVHASADMVSGYIRENSATKVTDASIYNILSELSDMGVYSRRMSSCSKMYFDLVSTPHIHMYDSTTCEYRDIPDDGLLSLVETAIRHRRFPGYKVDGIEIQVLCHPTRRKK